MASERNIRVSIYITPDEQKLLAKNFKIDLPIEGQSKLKHFAGCVRSAALGKKVQYKQTNPIAQQQYAELARLSSNLNQITHNANIGNIPEIADVMALVKELRNKLLNITNNNEG